MVITFYGALTLRKSEHTGERESGTFLSSFSPLNMRTVHWTFKKNIKNGLLGLVPGDNGIRIQNGTRPIVSYYASPVPCTCPVPLQCEPAKRDVTFEVGEGRGAGTSWKGRLSFKRVWDSNREGVGTVLGSIHTKHQCQCQSWRFGRNILLLIDMFREWCWWWYLKMALRPIPNVNASVITAADADVWS